MLLILALMKGNKPDTMLSTIHVVLLYFIHIVNVHINLEGNLLWSVFKSFALLTYREHWYSN